MYNFIFVILKYEDLTLFGSRLFFAFLSIVDVQFREYLVIIIVVTILNNLQISSTFLVFVNYSDSETSPSFYSGLRPFLRRIGSLFGRLGLLFGCFVVTFRSPFCHFFGRFLCVVIA